MILAVTDACIFIELDQLGLMSLFFKLNIEVHTSVDVFNELFAAQQELLKAYEVGNILQIHSISADERVKISQAGYATGLSQNDRTVLFLAEKLGAMVLSTDKFVRNYARKNALECHGMIWVFDMLVNEGVLSRESAVQKLRQMIGHNIIYQNNTQLLKETGVRLSEWQKKAK